MDRQMDRQMDRWIDRWIDRLIDRLIDKQQKENIYTYRIARQQIDKLTKGKKIGRMIDRRYRQMDRQIDINKDRKYIYMDR